MENVDFTDDEILRELADLGYANIPTERFHQFKKELFDLIRHERSLSHASSSNTSTSLLSSDESRTQQRGSSVNHQSLSSSRAPSQLQQGPVQIQSRAPAQTVRSTAIISCMDASCAKTTSNCNKENVALVGNGRSSQYPNPAMEGAQDKVMIPPRVDQFGDVRRQQGGAVVPDRRSNIRQEKITVVADRIPLRGDQRGNGRGPEESDGARRQNVDDVAIRRPRTVQELVIPDGRRPFGIDVGVSRGENLMKRKTLRRCDDGQTSVSESFTESETSEAADVAGLAEQLRNTSFINSAAATRRPVSAPPSVSHASQHHLQRSHSACRQPSSYNLPDDYQGPKSLIRGMSSEPHVQHVKKCDPVARYQSYQHSWMSCRAPGDKAHKQLRWGVREKMLCHDQVIDKKPQRNYRANSYVIPSDKKRKTLRWQIRADLAQGVKPPSVFD